MILRSANIAGSPFLLSAFNRTLPVFGFVNAITALSGSVVSATSPAPDVDAPTAPLNNLLNPQTHLRWVSDALSTNDYVQLDATIDTTTAPTSNYVAFAFPDMDGWTFTIYGATTGSPSDFIEIFEAHTLTDTRTLIMEFPEGAYSTLRVKMLCNNGPVRGKAAVMYAGKLLRMERSVKVDVDHTPINRGLKTNVLTGFSESGNFLGRLVRNEERESKIEFSNITRAFYVADFDTAMQSYVGRYPFFMAWAPDDYADEVGYCWTIADPVPLQSPVTRRYSVNLQMRGIW